MKLLIKQKVFSIGDKYNVYDDNQQVVYVVKGEIFTFGARIHLYDTYENELFYIQQKLLAFMPKYEIYKGDTLYATISKKFSFFYPKLEVSGQNGNLTVDGSLFNMEFSISQNGNLIGSLSKEWLAWGDTYVLDVSSHQDAAFFTALAIAIDHCQHNEHSNNGINLN